MNDLPQLPYPPRVTEFTRPFWDSVERGQLTTTGCSACGFLTFPPKPVCPECWSEDVAYVPLSGRGILRTFTEICVAPLVFRDEAPYVIGIVDLEENVRLLSRVQAPYDSLQPDMPVYFVARPAAPVHLFEFALGHPEQAKESNA